MGASMCVPLCSTIVQRLRFTLSLAKVTKLFHGEPFLAAERGKTLVESGVTIHGFGEAGRRRWAFECAGSAAAAAAPRPSVKPVFNRPSSRCRLADRMVSIPEDTSFFSIPCVPTIVWLCRARSPPCAANCPILPSSVSVTAPRPDSPVARPAITVATFETGDLW